jgi:hypothetical protein
MDWSALLSTLGQTALIVGGGAWVLRAVFTHWLARDLERHKLLLAQQTGRELETFRHLLQLEAAERSATFSHLHTRRSEVIAGIHERLVSAEEAVEVFIDPRLSSSDPKSQERYEKAFDALRELYTYFRRHRIYLTGALCERVEALFRAMHGPAWNASYFHAFTQERRDVGVTEFNVRRESWKAFRESVPPVMREIENEFRAILGVSGSLDKPSLRDQVIVARMLDPETSAGELVRRTDQKAGGA